MVPVLNPVGVHFNGMWGVAIRGVAHIKHGHLVATYLYVLKHDGRTGSRYGESVDRAWRREAIGYVCFGISIAVAHFPPDDVLRYLAGL